MLSVWYNSGNVVDYHMGYRESLPVSLAASATLATRVQADGDELDTIFRQMVEFRCSIPWATGQRVMNWYGDHAKFIAGNIKL